jgi:hypothetical protein
MALITARRSTQRRKHNFVSGGMTVNHNSHCSEVRSLGYDLEMAQVTLSHFYLLAEYRYWSIFWLSKHALKALPAKLFIKLFEQVIERLAVNKNTTEVAPILWPSVASSWACGMDNGCFRLRRCQKKLHCCLEAGSVGSFKGLWISSKINFGKRVDTKSWVSYIE